MRYSYRAERCRAIITSAMISMRMSSTPTPCYISFIIFGSRAASQQYRAIILRPSSIQLPARRRQTYLIFRGALSDVGRSDATISSFYSQIHHQNLSLFVEVFSARYREAMRDFAADSKHDIADRARRFSVAARPASMQSWRLFPAVAPAHRQ